MIYLGKQVPRYVLELEQIQTNFPHHPSHGFNNWCRIRKSKILNISKLAKNIKFPGRISSISDFLTQLFPLNF